MLTEKMKQYVWESQTELKLLIKNLCKLPAPSHHEHLRAEFVKAWFEDQGFAAQIDAALNVICPWGVEEHDEVLAVMAHTDTVFPDLEPMAFEEDETQFRCPGVTDDTAHLAVLMLCARYLMQNFPAPKVGVLFVANACEEGLGNLKGSRQIVKDYGARMRELITLDGGSTLQRVVNEAVGSHRYRVTVRTEGGHSFNAFGNRNAIHVLSTMIDTLYSKDVPQRGGSKTTYNVGTITGGTSVNTIAQEATMLYEYRSDNRECLAEMKETFHAVVEDFRSRGFDVEVELIGDRPCTGDVDPAKQRALEDRAAQSILRVTGKPVDFASGSTDCNAALAEGIPSICLSACLGGKCHTREEYLDLESLKPGMCLALDFLAETVK